MKKTTTQVTPLPGNKKRELHDTHRAAVCSEKKRNTRGTNTLNVYNSTLIDGALLLLGRSLALRVHLDVVVVVVVRLAGKKKSDEEKNVHHAEKGRIVFCSILSLSTRSHLSSLSTLSGRSNS